MMQLRPPAKSRPSPPEGGSLLPRATYTVQAGDGSYIDVCMFCEQMVLPFDDLPESHLHFECVIHSPFDTPLRLVH